MRADAENTALTDYCLAHYFYLGLCSLCGNTGVIDTRQSARSPAGARPGRLNWCLCPNGQALRRRNLPDDPTEEEYHLLRAEARG